MQTAAPKSAQLALPFVPDKLRPRLQQAPEQATQFAFSLRDSIGTRLRYSTHDVRETSATRPMCPMSYRPNDGSVEVTLFGAHQSILCHLQVSERRAVGLSIVRGLLLLGGGTVYTRDGR